MISFEQVTKTYPGGGTAVTDLDLTADTGLTTVLVGPSGCGKTTTLRMVNRMVEPTSGRILLDDRDVAGIDPRELRRGIGYVIQHAGLFPHRSVLDNVGTVPRLLGWDRARTRARSMELLELVGLDPALAGRYPHQLSGGQQQRVGVARALAADPPVLLLDEPFSAVDPVVRAGLQEEFLRLKREFGKTTIFVTHDIDEAITVGDKVAVLRVGGRLAQAAAPLDLLTEPADAFVAAFVGRDRGYRALGFVSGEVTVCREPTVPLGSTGAHVAHADGDSPWVLVVDATGIPVGWATRTQGEHAPDTPLTTADLHPLGTAAEPTGSLRQALDAALSSPAGRAVVLHPDGSLAGTITLADVVSAIDRADAPR